MTTTPFTQRAGRSARKRGLELLCALLILALTPPLSLSANPLSNPDEEPAGVEAVLATSAGVARIEDNLYARLTASAWIAIPNLRLNAPGIPFAEQPESTLRMRLYAPLHILIRDGASEESDTIRSEDWDEVGDILRTLRTITWGTPQGALFFAGGELSGVRIGHRTIVDSYINSLDINHFRWGLHAGINTTLGGADILLDSVADPGLLGGRAWIRPLALGGLAAPANRLAFGVSAFADVAAPLNLQIDEEGLYEVGPTRRLEIEEQAGATLLGIDAEYTLVQTERVSLTPYVDANLHAGRGAGLHTGFFLGFRVADPLVLDFRGEYRRLGADYLPVYFNSLYEIERYAFLPVSNPFGPDPTQRVPKLQWLRAGEIGARHGGLGEIGADWDGRVRISALFEDAEGPAQATMRLRATVRNIGPAELGFWFMRTAFEPSDGLFRLEDALVVAESRVSILPWLFVTGQLNRRWLVGAEGRYEPVDDFAVGVGAAFTIGGAP